MGVISEGKAKIYVPYESLRRKSPVFYNPDMRWQRDVTIASLNVFFRKGFSSLDPLAASGIRGIRILKETRCEHVVFNDANPNAIELIEKNLKLNHIPAKDYEILCKDANLLFLERRNEFDYIDIDPFGSPASFVRNVALALRPKSLLGVTATDTGALAGVYPNALLRRYGIVAKRTDCFKEVGIRSLITFVSLTLASYGFAFSPIYSHANHYFRVIGETRKTNSLVTRTLRNIGFVWYCSRCHAKYLEAINACEVCGEKTNVFGPLWLGKTKDKNFCSKLRESIPEDKGNEISLALTEIDYPFYYDLPKICKYLRCNMPKIEKVIASLKSIGFEASRTSLSPTGVKTNADAKTLIEVLKGLC